MRITTWAEYGLICALHLARRASSGPVTGKDIASSEHLPADYVEQILLRLRRADIVKSTRGAHGGYALARDASSITVRDVIQASELATFDLHCVSHPVDEVRCAESGECSIRPVWQMLQQRIDEVLASVNLTDLLSTEAQVRERVGLEARLVQAFIVARSTTASRVTVFVTNAQYRYNQRRMGLWTDWRIARERRQRASDYLRALAHEPDAADVSWLTSVVPDKDESTARRELRVARRALAMIVAERDALDDQTASDVNHVLAPVLYAESRRDPAASEVWNERWRAYTQSIATRGAPEAPHARIARVMLEGAGVVSPSADELARAVQIVQTLRTSANDALRSAFGAVSLPDDVRPSAIRSQPR